jgi:hypothetical protein
MAIFAYLDASGNKDHRAMAVAGFIAPEARWPDFNREWVAVLSEFGVTALHMKDFTSSQREFAGWDKDEAKRQSFVSRVTSVMNDFTDDSLVGVLFMDDYYRANETFQIRERFGGPYSVTAFFGMLSAREWRDQHYAGESLSVFLERGDNDQGELFTTLKRFGYTEPVVPLDKRTLKDGKPKYVYPFQAADFLAYEAYKGSKKTVAEGKDEVVARKTLLSIKHTGGRMETWRYTDEYSLSRICERLRVPRREP